MYNIVINIMFLVDKPKTGGVRRAHGDVDSTGNILVGKLEAKDCLEHLGIHGRTVLERVIYK
jgi:hypothetical protein